MCALVALRRDRQSFVGGSRHRGPLFVSLRRAVVIGADVDESSREIGEGSSPMR